MILSITHPIRLPLSLDYFIATLQLIPLRNLWVKHRCKGVVFTENLGHAVVVRLCWNGVLLFIPSERYRQSIESFDFLSEFEQDARFAFVDPWDLQPPPSSGATKIVQQLLPVARAKWDLGWLIQDLEQKYRETEILLTTLATSCFKPQMSFYRSKLGKISTTTRQAKQLMTECEQYIDQAEIAITIVDENPEVLSALPDAQILAQRITLLLQTDY